MLLFNLHGEGFRQKPANRDDNARYVPGGYDICARGFWNRGRDAYFNVRAFHPNSPSYCSMGIHHTTGMDVKI